MRLFTILLSILFTLTTAAQPLEKISQLLKARKFQLFKAYIDTPQSSNVDYSWEIVREVVPGYWEGVVDISEFRNPVGGKGNNRIIQYRIDLLATEQTIFYFRYNQIYNKRTGQDTWEPYDSVLTTFTDEKIYEEFQNEFRTTWNAALIPSELFMTSVVYGEACGITGQPPVYKMKLDTLLAKKDKKGLMAWLQSPNAEKQLYALQGFEAMQAVGYNLSDEEGRLIKVLRTKKGIVKICGGCIYSQESIQNLIGQATVLPDNSSRHSMSRVIYSYILPLFLILVIWVVVYLCKTGERLAGIKKIK